MVRILSDSTCDLSPELIEKYQITILPLHVLLDEEDFRDRKNITADDIFEWADEHHTTPTTSAPSPQEVIEVLEPLLNDGNDVICFAVSASMSSSINSMRLAAEALDAEDHVWCMDSQNLSTGVGLLVIEAAIMAQEGRSAKEIVEHIEELRPLVRSSFVVDTLTYLHRGGRCSSVAALAGGMLKLHPEIIVADGKMTAAKKYRGKIHKAIHDYIRDLEPGLKNAKPDRVFITHSGCEQDILDDVYNYLKELNIFDEILITRAGGVISSHCGPGTLGVLYIEKKM